MKGYSVFKADQIDGLPERYRVFANLSAHIRHVGSKAYCRPILLWHPILALTQI
ncbi:hypothetical protein BLJAPNOD_05130 [Ensifer sp. M14]|nr:hypothetical protein BLJAPNOD_05130 [Ensifer sp. M14]